MEARRLNLASENPLLDQLGDGFGTQLQQGRRGSLSGPGTVESSGTTDDAQITRREATTVHSPQFTESAKPATHPWKRRPGRDRRSRIAP